MAAVRGVFCVVSLISTLYSGLNHVVARVSPILVAVPTHDES